MIAIVGTIGMPCFLYHSFFNAYIVISQVLRRDPNGTPGKRVVLSGLYAGAKRPIQKEVGKGKKNPTQKKGAFILIFNRLFQ
jgi:hypothetical protein